jgi:hypothetical protein
LAGHADLPRLRGRRLWRDPRQAARRRPVSPAARRRARAARPAAVRRSPPRPRRPPRRRPALTTAPLSPIFAGSRRRCGRRPSSAAGRCGRPSTSRRCTRSCGRC